ncbi:MAG: hypothetical protein R6W69_08565 [Anaerolineales bacterium]
MPPAKFDIIITTVRYAPDGKIEMVRAFERRGATFSDHVLLSRDVLLEKIKDGKKCVSGRRKEFLAGTFEVDKTVQVVGDFITTEPNAKQDSLQNVPIF